MPPHKIPLSSIRLPAIRSIRNSKPKLMGCASSQAAEVKAQQEQDSSTKPSAPAAQNSESTEVNQNGNEEAGKNPENSGINKYPPAEAFIIPLDQTEPALGDGLIKKHPPKRLQRLVEQSQQQEMAAATTTIEDLEDKLARAEIRRQKYLQQRVGSTLLVRTLPNTIPSISEKESDSDDISSSNIKVVTINDNVSDGRTDDDDDVNDDSLPKFDDIVKNDSERSNEYLLSNNNNEGVNQSSLRNFTATAASAKATVVAEAKKTISINDVNKDDIVYRSPGDGDESKEEIALY